MTFAVTAAAISAVAAIGGMATGIAGSIQSANAQRAQARYQADVARVNQTIAGYQADSALEAGAKKEQQQRLQAASLKGTQRAVMAARGLDLGEGSPLDILTGTDILGEQDALTIRTNAAREAWGYRTQGASYGATAGMYDATANNTTAAYGVASSLLSGAGQVADAWYRYKRYDKLGGVD
jgi:hypothetical protein